MKHLIRTFIFALLVDLATTPLRANFMRLPEWLSPIIAFVILAVYTFFVLRYYKNKIQDVKIIYAALAIFLGVCIPEVVPRLCIEGIAGSYPDLLWRLFGPIAGYFLFSISKIYWKILAVIPLLLIAGWFTLPGNNYFYNKQDCGTYTGKVDEEKVIPIELLDANGAMINLDTLDCEYLVLYCWQMDWGVSKGNLPDFGRLKRQYEGVDGLKFYAAMRMIDNEPISSSQNYVDKWGLEGVAIPQHTPLYQESIPLTRSPMLLLMDKNGKLLYKFNNELSKSVLKKFVERMPKSF